MNGQNHQYTIVKFSVELPIQKLYICITYIKFLYTLFVKVKLIKLKTKKIRLIHMLIKGIIFSIQFFFNDLYQK